MSAIVRVARRVAVAVRIEHTQDGIVVRIVAGVRRG